MNFYEKMGGENRGKTGGCLSCVCVFFSVLSGIYCFSIENFSARGLGNYCTIDNRSTVKEFTVCAQFGKFNVDSEFCAPVYT